MTTRLFLVSLATKKKPSVGGPADIDPGFSPRGGGERWWSSSVSARAAAAAASRFEASRSAASSCAVSVAHQRTSGLLFVAFRAMYPVPAPSSSTRAPGGKHRSSRVRCSSSVSAAGHTRPLQCLSTTPMPRALSSSVAAATPVASGGGADIE
jgi:hypothetical protein